MTLRECPRKYYYSNVAGLRSLTPSIEQRAFSFGTAMHKVLEGFYKLPNDRRTLKYLTSKWRSVSRDLDDEHKELGLGMVRGYYDWVSVMDSGRFITISSEKRLGMKVKTPIGDVQFSGQMDSLWLEKQTGKLYIIDHKTYTNFPSDHFFNNNPQMYSYLLLLQKNGLTASGFIFNILRKVSHVEPAVNKDGSLSIRNANVSEKSFVETAERCGIDLADPRYAEFLDKIRQFPAYKRVEQEIIVSKLKQAERELQVEATALLNFYKFGFYSVPGDHCAYCSFKHLCDVQSSGGNVRETIEKNYSVSGTLLETEL